MSLYTGMEGISFKGYDFMDKEECINQICFDMLNRCSSMFKYEIPDEIKDTFKPEFMDVYLFYYGHAVFFKSGEKPYVTFGNWGGDPDPYYIPRDYVVANPYLTPGSVQLKRGVDCVVIKNDMHAQGLKRLFEKYATLLCENNISRLLAEYNSRISDLLAAEDDKTKKSAELFLQRIVEGKLGVVASNAMLDSFKAYRQTSGTNTSLLPLIEHHQYIKSEWLSDIGLDSNWNGKREAVNSAETALNKDYLMPLVDQMLDQRKKAFEKIKELFGYDIKVELASSWETNSKEEDAELEQLENAAEEGGNENAGTEETPGDIQSDGRDLSETEDKD